MRLPGWTSVVIALVACGGGGGGTNPPVVDGGGIIGGPDARRETQVSLTLTPEAGVTGAQTVNLGLPLAPGMLTDDSLIRVSAGGTELPAAHRGLARFADGSWRSIQLQFEVDVATTTIDVEVGVAGAAGPGLQAVDTTLAGTGTPRVWVTIPPTWMAQSGVVGPIVPRASVAGGPLDAWGGVCDYARWDTDAFISGSINRDVWLFDRVTAMYRGYAITGEASPQRSAYREAELYRAGVTVDGNGVATAIAVPGASDDLKYHYTQGLAIHYLLTGDDRFREAAEAVARRAATHWPDPGYAGGGDFWTERHAGFGLLAYEWAAMVSDDQGPALAARSDEAVTAYLAMQASYPPGYTDTEARCFAHSADAHGEGYGYDGCSPWMSAILADALDGYARRVGGARASEVSASLVKLGRIIARDGRDGTGRPFYWMGVGVSTDEVDDFDEHWGESAYLVALAWAHGGRTDPALRTAADELVTGTRERGEAGQLRSFNWQCRSAVMTPALLAP
ncbi:MAG: hypothetical protein KBG28_22555 [Kofleriaceae bacterium]|nr:hypothetical protein [Kofleriaceae bacterium]